MRWNKEDIPNALLLISGMLMFYFLLKIFFLFCSIYIGVFVKLPKCLPTTANGVLKDSGTLRNLDGKSASLYPQSVEIDVRN